MQLTLERNNLLKALNHIHRVVERRNNVPILENTCLEVQGDSLTLKSTDLDIEVRETIPADIKKEGGLTVRAHLLYDIVRKLPDGSEIMFKVSEDNMVHVSSGRSNFDLPTLPQDEFPDPTPGDFTHNFTIEASDLRNLIDRTQFAISQDDNRYYLNGIYIHVIEDDGAKVLRAVATDGHRLAQTQILAPKGSEKMEGVIIPRKAVAEIFHCLEGMDTDLNLEVSQTKIRFSIGTLVFTSKLIDGTFPDYNRVIPKENDKELVLPKGEFGSAVDRVATIANDNNRAVKLSADKAQLILTCSDPELGKAEEEISVDYEAEKLEIGFNPSYLNDISAQIRTSHVVFMLKDGSSPALIYEKVQNNAGSKGDSGDDKKDKKKSAKSSGDKTIYVLMPMRV